MATDDLPNLQRWLDKVGKRKAVKRGRAVPQPPAPSEASAEELEASGRKILQT